MNIIPTAFHMNGGKHIDANLLRVAIMISADGSFQLRRSSVDGNNIHLSNTEKTKCNNDIYIVRLHKPRKIERARNLLMASRLKWSESPVKESRKEEYLEGTYFFIKFPFFNPKELPSEWQFLDDNSKHIILEEVFLWNYSVLLWDGSDKKGEHAFFSANKHNIDIIQFIAISVGIHARISEYQLNNKPFYRIVFSNKSGSTMYKNKSTTFTEVSLTKKYCFEVPSSYLVLRRNNKVFITGNCAGTGNLEAVLESEYDRNGDSLIEHCVVSTYEYFEWKVLQERIGDKVRDIIPPTEANVVYDNGKVANADAMSKEFIENPIIRRYVDDPKITIILYENVPFHDETSNSNNSGGKTPSYVLNEMAKCVSKKLTNQLGNRFIWSAQNWYLRQVTDSYILFCPINYFKSFHLMDKKFVRGFLFNREHFHATASATSCIYWQNINEKRDIYELETYNIFNNRLQPEGVLSIKKVYKTPSTYFDKRKQADFIGFINISGFNLDAKSVSLYRTNTIKGHGSCFYLYPDVYIYKLPLFVAKLYPQEKWYEKGECGIYFTTSDGGDAYTRDPAFLKSCLLYTCLSNQNKCLSFDGSDGRRYQNELCLDNSATLRHVPATQEDIDALPLALKDLNRYAMNKETALDDDEKELIGLWGGIIMDARLTANYNPEFNYGVYQIIKELNTFHEEGSGKSKKKIYDYPGLNGNLSSLRDLLKAYYKSHITDKMFKYELLK